MVTDTRSSGECLHILGNRSTGSYVGQTRGSSLSEGYIIDVPLLFYRLNLLSIVKALSCAALSNSELAIDEQRFHILSSSQTFLTPQR